jgi:hypothetical protein
MDLSQEFEKMRGNQELHLLGESREGPGREVVLFE